MLQFHFLGATVQILALNAVTKDGSAYVPGIFAFIVAQWEEVVTYHPCLFVSGFIKVFDH